MRIHNAVLFLLHPESKASSMAQKIMFLRQQKGLTQEELDEAFRRAGLNSANAARYMFHLDQKKNQLTATSEEIANFNVSLIFAFFVVAQSTASSSTICTYKTPFVNQS
jgi:hypothetical protein